jgi:hypothetical protein
LVTFGGAYRASPQFRDSHAWGTCQDYWLYISSGPYAEVTMAARVCETLPCVRYSSVIVSCALSSGIPGKVRRVSSWAVVRASKRNPFRPSGFCESKLTSSSNSVEAFQDLIKTICTQVHQALHSAYHGHIQSLLSSFWLSLCSFGRFMLPVQATAPLHAHPARIYCM